MEVTLADLRQTYSSKESDELLRLHARGTLTDVAYEALEAELAGRQAPVPPRPQPNTEIDAPEYRRRMTLAAHWAGQASLASAYWLVGTLGFWLVYAIAIVAYQLVPALAPVAIAAVLAVLVFAWVSIWRCWKNTRWPAWGYVARALVIVYAVLVAAVLVTMLLRAGVLPDLSVGGRERSLME